VRLCPSPRARRRLAADRATLPPCPVLSVGDEDDDDEDDDEEEEEEDEEDEDEDEDEGGGSKDKGKKRKRKEVRSALHWPPRPRALPPSLTPPPAHCTAAMLVVVCPPARIPASRPLPAACPQEKKKSKKSKKSKKRGSDSDDDSDDGSDDEGGGHVSADELACLDQSAVIPRSRRKAAVQAAARTAVEINTYGSDESENEF